MDLYKRGMIQITDFERILTETNFCPSMTVTGGKNLSEDNTFSWNINAKQQIGLVLSRHYKSLQESFDRLFSLIQLLEITPRKSLIIIFLNGLKSLKHFWALILLRSLLRRYMLRLILIERDF